MSEMDTVFFRAAFHNEYGENSIGRRWIDEAADTIDNLRAELERVKAGNEKMCAQLDEWAPLMATHGFCGMKFENVPAAPEEGEN